MKLGVLIRLQNTLDFFERAKQDDYSRGPSFSDQRELEAQMRLVDLADELGYDMLWLLEEHFGASAMTGNPLMLAAAVASRTRRAGLGTILTLTPLKDPVGTAEAISMLSCLLNDRPLAIALGHPPAPHELDAFGIAPKEALPRLKECMQILHAAFANEWFSHEGTFWDIGLTTIRPRSLRSDLGDSLLVSSLALSAEPDLAAQALATLHVGLGDLEMGSRAARSLSSLRQKSGLDLSESVITLPLFCSESKKDIEAAREWWAQGFDADVWHYGVQSHPATCTVATAKDRTVMNQLSKIYEKAKSEGIFGTPEECLAQLQRLADDTPFQHVAAQMHFGLMPIDVAERSLRLFADQVLPALKNLEMDDSPAPRESTASSVLKE